MFAFIEALMDWTIIHDLQQASEIITVSKQFYGIYKNKVQDFEPFIYNSFLHRPGKIINLITRQVKHYLDAKSPRYIFNHGTKQWTSLSILPQELIDQAISMTLNVNLLSFVISRNYKEYFIGMYDIYNPHYKGEPKRIWHLTGSGNIILDTDGISYLTTMRKHFCIWVEELKSFKTAKLSYKNIDNIAIIKQDKKEYIINYLHEGKLKELVM